MNMNKRRFDLIISDIDGCLTPETPDIFNIPLLTKIREHNEAAMQYEDRPPLTVCTGRPQPFAEAICRVIGNVYFPCIAENGVWLYHPGSNEYYIDPAITEENLMMVDEARRWLRKTYDAKGLTVQPGKTASVSLYHSDRDALLAAIPEIKEQFERKGWDFRVTASWYYINCDLPHVNKASGIKRLLSQTGICQDRTVGIGDTVGDRFIADEVAYFACPSNAEDVLKPRAHYISKQPEIEGVVEILEHLRNAPIPLRTDKD